MKEIIINKKNIVSITGIFKIELLIVQDFMFELLTVTISTASLALQEC